MIALWLATVGAFAADLPDRGQCAALGGQQRAVSQTWFAQPNTDPWPGLTIGGDTAAWTRLTRSLEVGHLPPQGAVLAEELLQAIPTDEPPPAHGHPFAVRAEVAASPWERDAAIVRLTVTGRRPKFLDRPRAHVVLVIDEAVELFESRSVAREGVQQLITGLRHDDLVSIVASDGARLAMEATRASDAQSINAALDDLRLVRKGRLSESLDQAWHLLDQEPPDTLRRIVLVSDGELELIFEGDRLMDAAAHHARNGIGLVGLGFGDRYARDDSIEAIVQAAGGPMLHLSYPFDGTQLAEHIGPVLEPAVRDVRMLVEWDETQVKGVHRVGNHTDRVSGLGPQGSSVGGEIGVGQTTTVLYEVRLHPGADGRDLGNMSIQATPPGRRAVTYRVEVPGDMQPFESASPDLRIALAAASLGEVLAGEQTRDRLPPVRVAQIARKAIRPEYDRDRQLADMADRAVELLGYRKECYER